MKRPSNAPGRDPELSRLLIEELERHALTLAASVRPGSGEAGDLPSQPTVTDDVLRAVHALKGSAGLGGERELASALVRLERRMKEGDSRALLDAASLVQTAVTRLKAGESAVEAAWPVPPDDLEPRPLDPQLASQYAAEVADRLARIDEALENVGDPTEAAHTVYRHVHTLKGAASAAGDEPMTWFCHGLEEALKGANSPRFRPGSGTAGDMPSDAAQAALETLAGWRVVLRGLLDDPETALATLRSRGRPSQVPRATLRFRPGSGEAGDLPSGPRKPSVRPRESDLPPRSTSFDDAAATIRVAALDVDRLLERFDAINLASENLAARAERVRENAVGLRQLRASLGEALRLIGPPRPWGVPLAAVRRIEHVIASLAVLSEDLDGASGGLLVTDHRVRDSAAEAKRQLSEMRQTSMAGLFARLATTIESEARRSGRAVVVRTRGAELTVDRRLAEQLVEPCLQLARNAVAHGIEAPEVRASMDKPVTGTIWLAARKLGDRLSIAIEDDGSGVDVRHVRERALSADLITPAIADAADDDTLLSLLFVPGFSTRDSSDLLAGRGIGLEIARSATQRLGGAIRISSRAGEGFSARIEVPTESSLVTMLWVRAGSHEFALSAAVARRVRIADPAQLPPPHLLECLHAPAAASASHVVELELEGDDGAEPPVALGLDGVGRTEELLVRPLGPLVAGLGPYAGAIVRGDGSLRLAIDPWAVAARARALAATVSSLGAGA
jgi:two-component system chemotaxis sensor kinase CheA